MKLQFLVGHSSNLANLANSMPSMRVELRASMDSLYRLSYTSLIPMNTCSIYPYAPWCWYIYLQNWAIFGVNVGVHIPAPWFASSIYGT